MAAIVKRRRSLAARAAAEREKREQLEREQRLVRAQEATGERAVMQVTRTYDSHSAEARCSLRCQPLGYDRHYRRFWYFRSAPDRLFVESHWASPDIEYTVPPLQGW